MTNSRDARHAAAVVVGTSVIEDAHAVNGGDAVSIVDAMTNSLDTSSGAQE
jgi:hypothetical protein